MRFEDFARIHGLVIQAAISDGKIHRVDTEAKRGHKNGAYLWDGRRGWVCAHDNGGEVIWFSDESQPWTPEEKHVWKARKEATEREIDRKHADAALRATAILRTCKATEHGYLRLKGLGDVRALVTPEEALFVPMRNLQTNELQGAQLITWDAEERRWDKKMIPGMKAKGAVFRLGRPNSPETILCEGYATGLSLLAAITLTRLNVAVLVAFSDHNLAHVAPMIGGRVYVYADNDASGAGERAAIASGKPYCMSDVIGHDANDDHAKFGIYAVSAKVMALRSKGML